MTRVLRSFFCDSFPHSIVGACLLVALTVFGGSTVSAHSPVVDAALTDWCLGAASTTRVEDSGATLTCGNCSVATNRACRVATDCPAGNTCVNPNTKSELVWWDDRTDGAVNDLGTVAITSDNTNLYVAAGLWVDPDPVSLPFGQVALDFRPGGLTVWHDPNNQLKDPGYCSVSTDRGCTETADCNFCSAESEPPPSTRPRTCGSGCSPLIPGNVCVTGQTCVDLGLGGLKKNLGVFANPARQADYLLVFDFSLWLVGAGDAVLLMEPDPTPGAPTPWRAVQNASCTPSGVCDFAPAVNPGASGGSGGPPGSIEVAIPWSAFGCTGCPAACVCPGFGPGQDFKYTMTISRGNLTLDFKPDGAFEDALSERVAGATTTSPSSCAAGGRTNTLCELADGSTDAFIPAAAASGGRVPKLTARKGIAPSITLDWDPSCAAGDTDYEVYEGTLGSWYSHVAVPGLCTTGGARTATFNAGAGNRYYLVVPSNGTIEGSYGSSTALAQRPAAVPACKSQSLGTCP